MTLKLVEKLHLHARQAPDEIAIRQIIPDAGGQVTWRELSQRVIVLAQTLGRRLPPGAAVMLCSANRVEFAVAFLGVLAARMTVFPVAPDIAAPELFSAGQRSGAAAIISIGQPDLAADSLFSDRTILRECAADAVLHTTAAWNPSRHEGASLLLLSSGTTGRPKIVRRDSAAIDAVSRNMVEAIQFTRRDRVLAATPLCHSYGMEHGLLCPIWSGSCAHLYQRFDPAAAINELFSGSVSVFPGVPFMFESLCGAGGSAVRPIALRRAYSAGGPLPRSLFDAFTARFGVPIAQLYGLTEVGSVTFNDPSLDPFDPASVGRPMDGVSIRILDPQSPDIDRPLPIESEGHVAIEAPSMLSEYLDGELPPLIGGHFLTGDVGRLSAGGVLTVTGRIKLLIDIAGRKVNPLEVEQIICEHESVGECVVVPLRMTATLYRLKAIVTPARIGILPDSKALRDHCKARLSSYKVPRLFEIREFLPRSPAGKILRQGLDSGD